MKTTLCFILTLLTFATLTFVPNSFAQDDSPEYVVRVIYFIPNDREPDPNMDEKLDTSLKEAQQFYAAQMEAHGFGRKTFRFEADENEKVVVHHVNGKFNDAYYQNPSTKSWIVWEEIEELFDLATSKNIYLIALEISSKFLDGSSNIHGRADIKRGTALVPASNLGAVIHELGHTFGLAHDSRVNANLVFTLPGYLDQMTNSFCAAEWLDVNRYFNPIQKAFNRHYNENTNIKMLTPSLDAPPADIRLQFEVNDPDGLHQVQLFKPSGFYSSVIAYESLSGNRATVEFVTDELVGSNYINLRILDMHGNFIERSFPIEITDLLPPPEKISIPDANLAVKIREIIGLAPNSAITQLDMLTLTHFIDKRADEPDPIRDLTGLEYAINLRYLFLYSHPVSDIRPLEKSTKLEVLYLESSQISDVSQFKHLTNLKSLGVSGLHGNKISDIRPLQNLTNLQEVRLTHSEISDISPLQNLTNLSILSLNENKISDISPLENLTNLQELDINRNKISDISPLENLTNLYWLYLRGNEINDISPLAQLKDLRRLGLWTNKISDITSLASLTNLNSLWLSNNQISDVNPLIELENLQELYLVGNPIKNRKPLLELLRKNPDVKIYLEYGKDPLPVTLSHFRAELTDAGVVLKWTTESEVDNAGFYIYRSETKDGEFKVVNPTMVQGAGTTGERNEYNWTDTTAKPNTVYYYRIEDVSHAGVRKQLATVRMRGLVSASGKLTTIWADLKAEN